MKMLVGSQEVSQSLMTAADVPRTIRANTIYIYKTCEHICVQGIRICEHICVQGIRICERICVQGIRICTYACIYTCAYVCKERGNRSSHHQPAMFNAQQQAADHWQPPPSRPRHRPTPSIPQNQSSLTRLGLYFLTIQRKT